MPSDFKPNIYPIIYWALAFGIAAGMILVILNILAQYITILWFPVFLAGLCLGAYRNYKKQKHEYAAAAGTPATTGTPWEEFKEAATDIADASRDLMQEEAPAPETTQEKIIDTPPMSEPEEQLPVPDNEDTTPPNSAPPAAPPSPLI